MLVGTIFWVVVWNFTIVWLDWGQFFFSSTVSRRRAYIERASCQVCKGLYSPNSNLTRLSSQRNPRREKGINSGGGLHRNSRRRWRQSSHFITWPRLRSSTVLRSQSIKKSFQADHPKYAHHRTIFRTDPFRQRAVKLLRIYNPIHQLWGELWQEYQVRRADYQG